MAVHVFHEQPDSCLFGIAFLPKLCDLRQPFPGGFKPLRVSIIPAVVFFLIHGGLRIFRNDFLNKPQYNLAFIFQGFLFFIQICRIGQRRDHFLVCLYNLVPTPQHDIESGQKCGFDFTLCKMGRGAMLTPVFFVTLPYKAPVFRVGVPDLAAINAATLAADNAPGKWMQAARKTPIRLAGFQLVLYEVEKLRFDNGRMAVRHIILRHLAFVDLLLFGEEIHREFLLQERVALVLFVGEDALHHLGPPHLFAARRGNTLVSEVGGDGRGGFTIEEQAVNQPDDHRLGLHNDRQPVRAFFIAEEAPVRKAYLSVCKTLALAPCDVLRNGAAFFLRQRGHDGNKQLAFSVQGADVLFFKENFNALFFELAHCG